MKERENNTQGKFLARLLSIGQFVKSFATKKERDSSKKQNIFKPLAKVDRTAKAGKSILKTSEFDKIKINENKKLRFSTSHRVHEKRIKEGVFEIIHEESKDISDPKGDVVKTPQRKRKLYTKELLEKYINSLEIPEDLAQINKETQECLQHGINKAFKVSFESIDSFKTKEDLINKLDETVLSQKDKERDGVFHQLKKQVSEKSKYFANLEEEFAKRKLELNNEFELYNSGKKEANKENKKQLAFDKQRIELQLESIHNAAETFFLENENQEEVKEKANEFLSLNQVILSPKKVLLQQTMNVAKDIKLFDNNKLKENFNFHIERFCGFIRSGELKEIQQLDEALSKLCAIEKFSKNENAQSLLVKIVKEKYNENFSSFLNALKETLDKDHVLQDYTPERRSGVYEIDIKESNNIKRYKDFKLSKAQSILKDQKRYLVEEMSLINNMLELDVFKKIDVIEKKDINVEDYHLDLKEKNSENAHGYNVIKELRLGVEKEKEDVIKIEEKKNEIFEIKENTLDLESINFQEDKKPSNIKFNETLDSDFFDQDHDFFVLEEEQEPTDPNISVQEIPSLDRSSPSLDRSSPSLGRSSSSEEISFSSSQGSPQTSPKPSQEKVLAPISLTKEKKMLQPTKVGNQADPIQKDKKSAQSRKTKIIKVSSKELLNDKVPGHLEKITSSSRGLSHASKVLQGLGSMIKTLEKNAKKGTPYLKEISETKDIVEDWKAFVKKLAPKWKDEHKKSNMLSLRDGLERLTDEVQKLHKERYSHKKHRSYEELVTSTKNYGRNI